MTDACPHCPDGHDLPRSKSWGVYVAPTKDGDGQPATLHVAPSGGSHVAESDADWLRGLIKGDSANATEIINEILAPLNGRLAAAESEGLAAHQRAEKAEAAVARVRQHAEEWARRAPADDWGDTPQDTVLSDAGRFLLAVLDAPEAGRDA
ncbi:hypothetical protein [Streptosporangium sp. V21-05]|uniref:hypothetical protein n=1 Tax=Streptosporangium sp. V21-05 TaxID=3446115 RepID=UPI003F535635